MQVLGPRRAEWIWRRRDLHFSPWASPSERTLQEANRYLYFRREFDLPGPVQEAPVVVSADGRYQLYVNGRFVGRGPARCDPGFQYVDPYDLAPYLQPGRNVVAALAHAYGRHTAWYELPRWEHAGAFGCGGFFLQGEALTSAGPVRLDTGDTWQYLESEAWARRAPGGALGFNEHYDARLAPEGWAEVGLDDEEWEPAQVLRLPGLYGSNDIVPFPVLVVRPIPPLQEELRLAEGVGLVGEVANPEEGDDLAEALEEAVPGPLLFCRAAGLPAALQPEGAAEIVTDEEHGLTVVFDFGREVVGRVHLELDAPSGAEIDLTCGEYLRDDGQVLISRALPKLNAPPVHRYAARQGLQTFERFEVDGFRYLQLTLRHCERPLRLRQVGVRFTCYPVARQGSFACSDPLLDRIWQAGAYTLQLCRADGFMDCPSREQRQWVGDAYVQALAGWAAFGDHRLVAQLLRQVAQSQRADGMTSMATPGDFGRQEQVNIPDYCLYWIMTLERYLAYSGDLGPARELYPAVDRALGWFKRHLDGDGLLNEIPGWTFVDWAALDRRGASTAVNAQFVEALRAAAVVARAAGQGEDALAHEALAGRVARAINDLLWDEERGVYVDARYRGHPSRRVSQQSNAAAIAFGVAPRERWQRILDYILDERRLVLTPWQPGAADPFDDEQNVVRVQPFYAHHLHRALARAGRIPALLNHIRRHWGPMVEADATLWERWEPGPDTSKCHAWSATPTYDLSTYILGLRPGAPGCAEFVVAPEPGYLDWARGVFPSSLGDIPIQWRWAAQGFELSLEVPAGATAGVVFPEFAQERAVIVHNEQTIEGEREDGRWLVRGLRSGRHHFLVRDAVRPQVEGPAAVARQEAAPGPAAPQPEEPATAKAIVDELVRHFSPQKAGGLTANIALDLSGEVWTLIIAEGRCRPEPGALSPRLTLRAQLPVFLAIVEGRLDGMKAFMTGKLKISGDFGLAQRFQDLFEE